MAYAAGVLTGVAKRRLRARLTCIMTNDARHCGFHSITMIIVVINSILQSGAHRHGDGGHAANGLSDLRVRQVVQIVLPTHLHCHLEACPFWQAQCASARATCAHTRHICQLFAHERVGLSGALCGLGNVQQRIVTPPERKRQQMCQRFEGSVSMQRCTCGKS